MSRGGRFTLRSLGAIAIVAALAIRTTAVTRLASADGQFWDIQDTSPWSQDSGGIATGGRANPFNGFGYLKIRVRTGGGVTLVPNQYLTGFGLAHDGSDRFDSITPVLHGDVIVSRALFAPADADYLRYVDSYTNTAADDRMIDVAWGGAAGAFEDGGPVDGGRFIERQPDDRPDRYLRHGHAECEARGRSGARSLRPWSVGACPGFARGGPVDGGRRHVRRPVREPVAWLRSRAHRLCVHADRASGPDRLADDVRREGAERGLRSARRVPDSTSRCAGRAEVFRAVFRRPRRRFPSRDRRSRA